ncbi:MAG: Sfum_1244 family protein [Thiotrichales bacterium]
MLEALKSIGQTVQYNCDIADARYAADYTLCVYLLKMREMYRWAHGIDLLEELPNAAVGDWVRAREEMWQALEAAEFEPLAIAQAAYDPFDDDAINAALHEHRLVYSGGLGNRGAPHFFLADLAEQRVHGEYTILIADREYARDLTAPPAMTRGANIFVRRESLRRLIWERVQEWRWNRCDSALGRALEHYAIDTDPGGGLNRLVEDQLDVVLWHELGEVEAGRGIEEQWQALLAAVSGTPAELELRAVRDNLADVSVTLPALLDSRRWALLDFYFGTLSPMRRRLYPALVEGYEIGRRQAASHDGLFEAVARGKTHWREVMSAALALSGAHAIDAAALHALIERSYL